MTVKKLNSREQQYLGLRGEPGEDYEIRKDLVEIKLSGAYMLDAPDTQVDRVHPGDVVLLWSQAQLAPDKTLVLAEVHPELRWHGFCSFPHVFTADAAGRFTVLFRCERELDLSALPYLAIVASLGTMYQ